MADRIKGITIEIDGQTTGLKKSLGDITSQSISIQKELTDVNRLLKFDPGNTAALTQKQELLSKQIEVTSQKLQGLKNAQSQVEAQFASGKIGEDQYRSFQREVEFTEASLNKFKTAYKEATTPPTGDMSKPIKELNEEAEKSKGIFNNMGEYIKRGIGMGIGGDIWDKAKEGLGSVITFGGDAQKALNGLQAQTGATSSEMDNFNQIMTNVYNNNFGESMDDVAQSMVQVQTYLKGTGEDIQAATQNAIGFRDTFGVEVPESMRSVQALMKQFGVTSTEAFNLMAQGEQNGLNYSDELFDSINEYSPQFEKLGLDATDMFDIFKSGADNGAFNLDKVGDAVKELSIRTIDGSKTTQQGFQAMGLNADEMAQKFGAGGDSAKEAFYQVIDGLKGMNDPIAQSTAGVDLFGTQWEDLGPQVVTQLGSVKGAFDKTKNSMEQINQIKYNTPTEALEGLGRQIQTSILLPVSKELMPSLNDVANQMSTAFAGSDVKSGIESISQGLGELIKSIVEIVTNILPSLMQGLGWIMDNANNIATGIIAIGTAMEVFKVVGLVTGLVEAFKAAQIATEGLTIAQWLYNAAMAANPIGIFIAVIAGLVAAIIYLWNTNEGFRNAIIGAWTTIASVASTVWNSIATFFTVTIPAAFNMLIAFFTSTVPQFLTNLWTTISTGFITGWNIVATFFTTTLPAFFIGLWATISQAFTNGWNAIVTFFTTSIPAWIESVGQWFLELPTKIAFALGETLGSIIKWGTDTYSYLTTNVPIWINAIGTWFSQLPGTIMTWLTNVITNIQAWGSNMLTEATTAATNTYNAVTSWFAQLPGNIQTWLTNVITNITTWGSSMLTEASTWASNTITGIVNFFTQLPSQIGSWLTQVVTDIGIWGSNMFTEASTGMQSVFDGIVNTFTNLPAKMLEIGGHIVDGLKNGIKDAWAGMTGWIGDLCDTFINGVNKKMEVHSPSRVMYRIGGFVGEGFGLGIESTIGQISKQANAIANAAIPNVNAGNFDMGVNSNPIGSNSNLSTGSNLDAILAKMDSMTNAIANMQILMDSKMVGKLVTPSVSNNLAFNNGRKGWD